MPVVPELVSRVARISTEHVTVSPMNTGAVKRHWSIPSSATAEPSKTPVRAMRPRQSDVPSSPCTTRWPYRVRAANSTSVCTWLLSFVHEANDTTSAP